MKTYYTYGLLSLCLLCALCSPSESKETNAAKEKKSTDKRGGRAIVFHRVSETREHAFSLLIPQGWQTEGGIFRVNPLTQGGPAQSIAAKLDFAVKKDRAGRVMIHWLPDMLYFDARRSPAGQMGLFPPGSNYQGMTVYPLMPAEQYLVQIVFPYTHPNATNVKVLERRSLQDIAQKYQQRVRAAMPFLTFSYDAATMTVLYSEAGTQFKEKWMAVIENWGQMGAGMWGNKETFFLRAPVTQFKTFEPIFSVIQGSVKVNRRWLAGEIQGQMQRNQTLINTQQAMQRIEQQIVEHRQKTNAEIHNDVFLTLTHQEEYVNPYTKEVEMGSNQWRHRWINEGGEVIYTDDEYYDPNTDIHLQRHDYKRTPIRKRFPN